MSARNANVATSSPSASPSLRGRGRASRARGRGGRRRNRPRPARAHAPGYQGSPAPPLPPVPAGQPPRRNPVPPGPPNGPAAGPPPPPPPPGPRRAPAPVPGAPYRAPRPQNTVASQRRVFKAVYAGPAVQFPNANELLGSVRHDLSQGVNGHAWGAAARAILVADAITSFAAAFNNAGLAGAGRINDVYGNKRTQNIAAFLNGATANPPRVVVDPVAVSITGAVHTASDIVRRPNARPDPHPPAPTEAYLYVNVYEHGQSPLTPQIIANTICYTQQGVWKSSPATWIGQAFIGLLGSHNGESVWYRTTSGRIVSYPDASPTVYGPHAPLDWMHTTTSAPVQLGGVEYYLGWSLDRTTQTPMNSAFDEGMVSYSFALLPAPPQQSPLLPSPYGYDTLDVPDLGTWRGASFDRVQSVLRYAGLSLDASHYAVLNRWIPGALPMRSAIIDRKLRESLCMHYMYHSSNNYSLRSMLESAEKHFKSNFHLIGDRLWSLPVVQEIVRNTALAAFAETLQRSSADMKVVTHNFGRIATEFNKDSAAFGSTTSASAGPALALFGACSVSFLAMYIKWGVPSSWPRQLFDATFPGLAGLASSPALSSRLWRLLRRCLPKWLTRRNLKKPAASAAKGIKDYAEGTAEILLATMDTLAYKDAVKGCPQLPKEEMRVHLVRSGYMMAANTILLVPFIEEIMHHLVFAYSPALDGLFSIFHAIHEYRASGVINAPIHVLRHICLWALRFAGFFASLSVHVTNNLVAVVVQGLNGYTAFGPPDNTLKELKAQVRVEQKWMARASLNPITLFKMIWGLVLSWFRGPPKAPLYLEWREKYYGRHQEKSWSAGDRDLPAAWTDKSVHALPCPQQQPSTMVASAAAKPPNPEFKLIRPLTLNLPDVDRRTPRPTGFWFMHCTSSPGLAPARSDSNLVNVYDCRLNATPPMDQPTQTLAWANRMATSALPATDFRLVPSRDLLGNAIMSFRQHDPIQRTATLEQDWLAHFEGDAKKLARNAAALASLHADGKSVIGLKVKQTTVSVKTNELLFQREDDGSMKLKPRSIAAVDPLVQAAIGPELILATKRLAEEWPCANELGTCEPQFFLPLSTALTTRATAADHGPPDADGVIRHHARGKVYEGIPLHLAYGGKATDRDLSDWMWRALGTRGIHVIVAGDDNAMVLNIGKEPLFIWLDASMFDQSQSTGPLSFERQALQALGCSKDITDLLLRISGVDYRSFTHSDESIRLKRGSRPIRDTGGPDTSLGNGVVMGSACVLSLTDAAPAISGFLDSPQRQLDAAALMTSLVNCFAAYGFKMVGGQSFDLNKLEFLKGAWLPWDSVYRWTPLPSRILKCGKCWRDPAQLYDMRGVPRSVRRDLGARLFLYDQATQLDTFVLLPTLQAFVDKHRARLADDVVASYGRRKRVHTEWDAHKVAGADEVPRPRPGFRKADVDRFYESRYGLSPTVVAELAAQASHPAPFTFMSHPAYEVLAARDYG